MLGLTDPSIALAYALSLGSTLLCILYGAFFWNRGADLESAQIVEEAKWEEKEHELDETL